MFERDLPGENKSGLSFQTASDELPLETCETINGSWGYNITDRNYKTVTQVVQLLAGAAGRNANLLLNVGPMASGVIQAEFVDTLAAAGKWLEKYGESIYGTRGGPLAPQLWGVTTQKGQVVYIHLFKQPAEGTILIPGSKLKVKQARVLGQDTVVKFKVTKEGVQVETGNMQLTGPDTVIALELR